MAIDNVPNPECDTERGHCIGINTIGVQFMYDIDKLTEEELNAIYRFDYCPECGKLLKNLLPLTTNHELEEAAVRG